jgi:hypothetical protein
VGEFIDLQSRTDEQVTVCLSGDQGRRPKLNRVAHLQAIRKAFGKRLCDGEWL